MLDPSATDALRALEEIPPPAPVSYRPQTIGWLFVAIAVAAVAAHAAWRACRRWQANRYRREALRAMADLERRLDVPDMRTDALAALPALVKRTALACVPRARVARLSDADWLAFLDRTCPPGGFAAGPGRLLPRLAYESGIDPSASDLRALTTLVRRWIARHDPRLAGGPDARL